MGSISLPNTVNRLLLNIWWFVKSIYATSSIGDSGTYGMPSLNLNNSTYVARLSKDHQINRFQCCPVQGTSAAPLCLCRAFLPYLGWPERALADCQIGVERCRIFHRSLHLVSLGTQGVLLASQPLLLSLDKGQS